MHVEPINTSIKKNDKNKSKRLNITVYVKGTFPKNNCQLSKYTVWSTKHLPSFILGLVTTELKTHHLNQTDIKVPNWSIKANIRTNIRGLS